MKALFTRFVSDDQGQDLIEYGLLVDTAEAGAFARRAQDIHAFVLAHPRLAAALAPEAYVVARVLRKHQPRLPDGVAVFRTKEIGEESLLFLRYDLARTRPET